MNPTPTTFAIRPATSADWRALRLLLPTAFTFASGLTGLVATAGEKNHIVAAAALTGRLRLEPFPGPRINLHVIPPFRRQGIATALLHASADLAKKAEAKALYAWDRLAPDDPAVQSWRHLHFDHSHEMQEGRLNVDRALAHLEPIYQGLLQRNWIPPEAKLVPLNAVDPVEVAKLHVAYLGGAIPDVLARVRGETPDRLSPELSPALLLNHRVMAFSLIQRLPDNTALVESTVVDPALRGGWANAWLKHHGLTLVKNAGIPDVVYQTYDRHTDTRKFARQVGGQTRTMIEPYRLL